MASVIPPGVVVHQWVRGWCFMLWTLWSNPDLIRNLENNYHPGLAELQIPLLSTTEASRRRFLVIYWFGNARVWHWMVVELCGLDPTEYGFLRLSTYVSFTGWEFCASGMKLWCCRSCFLPNRPWLTQHPRHVGSWEKAYCNRHPSTEYIYPARIESMLGVLRRLLPIHTHHH